MITSYCDDTNILIQICLFIIEIQSIKVIHGDLHRGNILIKECDEDVYYNNINLEKIIIKVIDFEYSYCNMNTMEIPNPLKYYDTNDKTEPFNKSYDILTILNSIRMIKNNVLINNFLEGVEFIRDFYPVKRYHDKTAERFLELLLS